MAQAIGQVKSFENGMFYVRNTRGDVHQLKVGEMINEGDYVYGSYSNDANAKIIIDVLLDGAGDLVLAGDAALQFESPLMASIFSHNEAVVHVDSLQEGVALTAAVEDKLATGDTTEAGDETAAGEAVGDTERMVDTFASRTGAITDVTTDLRSTAPGAAVSTVNQTDVTLLETSAAPLAIADAITTAEDTSTAGSLATNDFPSSEGGNVWTLTEGTQNGTVVVNPDGTYTYTPNANYNGPDSFTYTITDADGDTSTATVSINVTPLNDGPNIDVTAYQSFTEGSATAGDIAFTFTASDPDTASDQLLYELINNSNGYLALGEGNTVVLTNAGAAAINADNTIVSTLTATVQVSDGSLTAVDSDVTTVSPLNDGPNIEAMPPESVYESGLVYGTVPSADSITTSGTFVVGDPDGLNDISSITIAGTLLNVGSDGLAGLVGRQITTPYGLITLTDYDGEGTFDYDYVLNAPVVNAPSADYHEYLFDISVSDGSNDATVPVTVTIVDDEPILGSIQDAIVANETGQVTGLIDINYGADGAVPPSTLKITDYDELEGVSYVLSADGKTLTATVIATGQPFYTLTLNPDGSYTVNYSERPVINYSLDFPDDDPHGSSTETITATAVGGTYTVDFNGALYDGTALIDLGTLSDFDNLKPTGVGFGVGDSTTAQTQINNNEGFIATFYDGSTPLDVSNFSFEIVQQGNAESVVVHWVALNDGVAVGSSIEAGETVLLPGSNVPVSFDIDLSDVSDPYDSVQVWFSGLDTNDDVRIEDFTLGTSIIAEDQPLNFEVTGYDSDGDVSDTSSFSVLLGGGVGPDYTLTGTDENEVLVGSSGSDSLYGEGGDDTLVFDSNDDVVDGGSGTDTLVLVGDTDIDFDAWDSSSLKNVEVIDLTSGDHDLTNLSLDDVVNMTDINNDIYILGNSLDKVDFLDLNGWEISTATPTLTQNINGVDYTFDVYINGDDPTVTVHVEQAITDSILP